MSSSYNAKINLDVNPKSLKDIEKLGLSTKEIVNLAKALKNLSIDFKSTKAVKQINSLNKNLQKAKLITDKIFDEKKSDGFGLSISKVRTQLTTLRKGFDSAKSAADRASIATGLLAGNFKKIRMESVAFAKASGEDTSKTIGNLSNRLKEIEQFPRTILAGNEAMSLLKRMQEMTIVGSKEFLEVSKAIGVQLGINANIQTQAARAANPMKGNQVFATPEQIKALGGRNKLIPPSMRLPQAGQSSGTLGVQSTFEIKNKPIEKAVKDIRKSSSKTANLLSQQTAFGLLPPAGGTTSPINRPGIFSPTNLGFGKNANQQGLFAMPGGRNARIKGGIGSAMIGGGFPALFGAGGISSLMGGVAGGIGGALAPGGGFAASILATAAASQIEKTIAFRKALNKVNLELENMGISSTFSRKQIKELAKEFEITNEEAIELAKKFKTFGPEQADVLLAAFGSRETFNTLSGLRNFEDVLGKIQSLREQISETTRQDLLQTLATKGSLQTQLKLERVIFDQRKKAFVSDEIKKIKILDVPKEFRQDLDNFKEIKKLQLGEEFEATNGSALKLLETEIKINEQLQFISEFQAPTDQLREMLNPMRQALNLSVSIRDGFEESFKGIAKGTMTVSEAFRNMLNRIADHFLDTAAKIAATQLQKSFLGLFSNMFNFSNLVNNAGNEMASQGARIAGSRNLGRRADGGPVTRGGSFIVGERGPELFVPKSSGNIIPNNKLGGGGNTSVVVNVDASGTDVQGDEAQAKELGTLISVAVKGELVKQQRPGGLLSRTI